METEGLEFLQFSFRWVNCLVLREIPFQLGLRLWDTYLAEGARMKEFLIYVLAAFLLTWEKELKQMDFQVSKHDEWADIHSSLCCLHCHLDMCSRCMLLHHIQQVCGVAGYQLQMGILYRCHNACNNNALCCRRWYCSCRSYRLLIGMRRTLKWSCLGHICLGPVSMMQGVISNPSYFCCLAVSVSSCFRLWLPRQS